MRLPKTHWNEMTMSRGMYQNGWSLPIIGILIVIAGAAFLSYQFGWWWLGGLVALYFGIAIISIVVRARTDTKKE